MKIMPILRMILTKYENLVHEVLHVFYQIFIIFLSSKKDFSFLPKFHTFSVQNSHRNIRIIIQMLTKMVKIVPQFLRALCSTFQAVPIDAVQCLSIFGPAVGTSFTPRKFRLVGSCLWRYRMLPSRKPENQSENSHAKIVVGPT